MRRRKLDAPYLSSVVIGRLAERDDLSGICGLLRLESDLGDAAGFRECERGRGVTAEGMGELREQVGLGVQRERTRRPVGGDERHLPVDECGLDDAVGPGDPQPFVAVRADSGRR